MLGDNVVRVMERTSDRSVRAIAPAGGRTAAARNAVQSVILAWTRLP
jgi:hypothetical protein